MTQPTTPGEARRQHLRTTRRVLAGTAIGAAALLTGIVAGFDSGGGVPGGRVASADAAYGNGSRVGDGFRAYGDDEFDRDDDDFGAARPYAPRQQSWQPRSQPQTRSGGS
ncbi:MAG: hypothetical protein ACKOA9_07600 [Actinomycetota bacterium]